MPPGGLAARDPLVVLSLGSGPETPRLWGGIKICGGLGPSGHRTLRKCLACPLRVGRGAALELYARTRALVLTKFFFVVCEM